MMLFWNWYSNISVCSLSPSSGGIKPCPAYNVMVYQCDNLLYYYSHAAPRNSTHLTLPASHVSLTVRGQMKEIRSRYRNDAVFGKRATATHHRLKLPAWNRETAGNYAEKLKPRVRFTSRRVASRHRHRFGLSHISSTSFQAYSHSVTSL